MIPPGSTVCGCSQYRVLGQHEGMAEGRGRRREEVGLRHVEGRGGEEVVVMVAAAVSARWNKVTLVDRCSVVCLRNQEGNTCAYRGMGG